MEIRVNVYDLTCINNFLHWIALGAYHTGVLINNQEYSYVAHSK